MDPNDATQSWLEHGYVVLPGFIPPAELAPAIAELGTMFPSADGFHDRTDARHARFAADEFAGIDAFPFASLQVSLVAVHERLIALAERLLGSGDIRIYSAEAWAKYTGAADYEQDLHRDYLNHTILVPTTAQAFQQLEMFVYLADVPADLGPPRLVSLASTAGLPPRPNWYPRAAGSGGAGGWVASRSNPELYKAEHAAEGPVGTVVAFQPGTLHRGAALTRERGARFTMHLGFRPAGTEWAQRYGWANRSHVPAWYAFVQHASPRQLELFGFPPPGHEYWTPDTLAGMALRYPELDLTPWRKPYSG